MKKQFTQIQVEYWSGSGKTDLDAALDMIKFKREIYGLFFCHLAIEKILKAHIVKLTKDHPPRIHELASLLRRTGIEMSNAQHELLGVLMLFHLEGRYSENFPKPVKNKVALEIHAEAKKLFIWLEAML